MKSFSTKRALCALPVVATLSGCGDYIFTDKPDPGTPPPVSNLPAGINAGGSGSPNDALSRVASPISFTATPHRGLEIANLTTGIEATPTLAFDLTTTGFDMKTSDGALRYDTRAGSTNVRTTNTFRNCIGGTCTAASDVYDVTLNGGATSTLRYATYGIWTKTIAGSTVTRFGAFAVGAPSTAAQLPTSGNATFNGSASGLVLIDGPTDDVSFTGTATLSADFAAKTISGAVTNIATRSLTPTQNLGTMNNINFTGGAISDNGFSGTTTAATASNPTVNLAGTIGQFNGTFFGPNATEAAGSFTLTRTGLSLVGAFGAAR